MGRFIFDWPDDLAQRVEAYRRGRGLKATAEAVRELLDAALTAPPVQDTKARPVADDEGKQAELRSSSNTKAAKSTARISVDVPLAGTFKRPIPQKSIPKPKR